MTTPPFKVKAVYDYASPHDDDLSFPLGQVITVTEEEDADWYVGEYTDASGASKSGLFPKNFVEKYEPAVPSRPARTARPVPAAPVPAAPAAEEPEVEEPLPLPVATKPTEAQDFAPEPTREAEPELEPEPEPAHEPEPVQEPTPKKVQEQSPAPAASKPAPAPAPAVASASASTPTKGPPPPVSEKPSSFRDRIAAFNKQEAPVVPLKPSGAPTGFIKKPFVAPPPSRNAYIPPPKAEPAQKVYRRDEDPEIAERQAQDQAAAESAGLTSERHEAGEETHEEAPKQQSLKERIAMLQQQQMEQAQRRAETGPKEKPKKPAKKRTEDSESILSEEAAEPGLERTRTADHGEPMPEDRPRERPRAPVPPPRAASPEPLSPETTREQGTVSDGNEADQSAADEVTDAAEDTTDTEAGNVKHEMRDQIPLTRAPTAPRTETDVGDEEDTTEVEPEEEEEEEEDEMDAETRRRQELRERMAKMSGGMGMAGMFGPQPGMAIPGSMPQKSRSVKKPRETEETPASAPQVPQARVPMIPVPGMQTVTSPKSDDTEVTVGREEEHAGEVTGERGADEVPDLEDVKPEPAPRASTSSDRPPQRAATFERGAPPPVPGERPVPAPPVPEGRAVPPPPPARTPQTHQPEDEPRSPQSRKSMEAPRLPELNFMGAPPPVPGSPRADTARSPPSASRGSSYFHDPVIQSEASSPGVDKRSSRAVPPVPGLGMASPPLGGRPPPPPPPAAANPASVPFEELNEEESEYEGDYDTDIGSSEKHKDALKAHVREPSYDDSTIADDSSMRSPPPVPTSPPVQHRAVPPLPPSAPAPKSRTSMDAPRAAPPPIPPPRNEDFDEQYEDEPPARGPPSAPAPVPAMASAAAMMPGDSSDDLYRAPSPPRRHVEKPTQDRSAPPPPAAAAPPRPSESGARPTGKSLDVPRTLVGRRSTEGSRPSSDGYIATEVDLGEDSQWWTQPSRPPPVFQDRTDLLCEIEDSSTSKRGGKTIIARDVYILFLDYSQTVVTARFDKNNPLEDVSFEQRHEPPPPKLRQDQLEGYWQRFGAKIADAASHMGHKKDGVVGDGSASSLPLALIKPHSDALLPVGTRAYGALIYANMANASVQQFDEIRPGDILTLRNAKLQGKAGSLHQKYSMDVGNHVAIVLEWDGTKKKVRALEQGREKKKTQIESFRLGDLKSGEARVWRVVGRNWVGWDSN